MNGKIGWCAGEDLTEPGNDAVLNKPPVEIPAECSGKIVAVLATSGQATEFGQALFRVEPNV